MTLLKALVVCLALANLGYFLWTHGIGAAEVPDDQAPVRTIQLVSEMARPASTARGTPPVGVVLGDTAAVPVSAQRCISVGPFRDVAEAAHAASTLRAGGYDPRQRVTDGEVWAGIWVYLPAPANPAANEQLLSKLKASGIEDALEMPGPTEGSVISLGLFSEPKRAQARVAQAQALGLAPGLADRKRNGNVYWVDVDLKPTDGALNPGDLENEAGHISRLEIKACPAVTP